MNPPPLCWGTNVLPAEDLRGLLTMLRGPAAAVRDRLAEAGGPDAGLGLWLPRTVAAALAGDDLAAGRVKDALAEGGLRIDTVNAFPAGDFHAGRVKERVYAPSWDDPARLDYTVLVARALQRLLPSGSTCVMSTSPGTWKGWRQGPAPRWEFARGLVAAARVLRGLVDGNGVHVVLAPEPEPGCTLETLDETIDFWHHDLPAAMGDEAASLLPHLGICLDLCHASVMGTDPAEAWRRLRDAGVPVAKIQISAALEIADPAGDATAVEALRAFDEPRWLHQTGARGSLGVHHRAMDLPEVFADLPRWTARHPWRVHFHAPLSADEVQGVATTSPAVLDFLRALTAAPPAVWPVLEIETYTWSALPGPPADCAAGIAGEILAVAGALSTSPAGASGTRP